MHRCALGSKALSLMFNRAMTKRGRPPTNGCQRREVFFRVIEVLYFYNQRRSAGAKHSCAVSETVQALKGKYRVSETCVKRILAEWQGVGQKTVFTVSKPTSDHIFVLDGKKCRTTLTLGIGPRPNYPRVNAAL
jgi:hypothetical protein